MQPFLNLLLIATALVPAPLKEEVTVQEQVRYYEVKGASAQALTMQMAEHGPLHAFGRRAWGFTAWEVRTEYGLAAGGDGCRLVDARAFLDVVTTLPRWEVTAGSGWQLRARWQTMLAKLVEHERTHRNHGVVAAQQVQAALQAIGTQRDCARVEVLVRQALRREANRAGGLSRAFDRDTNCGAKQGVGLEDGSGELRLSDKTNALASPR